MYCDKYIRLRNEISTMIKQAKASYFIKIILEVSDPRKLWNTINNAC